MLISQSTPAADLANDDSLFFRDDSVDIITLSERLNDFSHAESLLCNYLLIYRYYSHTPYTLS